MKEIAPGIWSDGRQQYTRLPSLDGTSWEYIPLAEAERFWNEAIDHLQGVEEVLEAQG